jgi:hypothetical protein
MTTTRGILTSRQRHQAMLPGRRGLSLGAVPEVMTGVTVLAGKGCAGTSGRTGSAPIAQAITQPERA